MVDDETFQEILKTTLIEDDQERFDALHALKRKGQKEGWELRPEQIEQLKRIVIEGLGPQRPKVAVSIASLVLEASDIEPVSSIESPWKNSKLPPSGSTRYLRWLDFSTDIFREAGVFQPDEDIRYVDTTRVHIESLDAWRAGSSYLTDRRIVTVGPISTIGVASKTIHRLVYEDEAENPYPDEFAYFNYDRISDLNAKWSFFRKDLRFKYQTKYAKVKGRVFYGPLWIKKELPPSVEVKEGEVEVTIELLHGIGYTTSRKEQQQQFFERLQQYVEEYRASQH